MIYVSSASWRWTAVLGVREDEAITKARAFLTLANEHPTTLSRQASGVLLLWDGQAARALSEFDTAIARDPGDPWSYAYRGWVLIVDGRYEEALSSIDEAIRRDPHAPLYFTFLRGAAALGMGRPEEAEQQFATVSRVNSDDQWAQLLLVPTYLSLKRSQDAWAAAARFNDLSVGLGDFPISVNLMQRGLGNGRLGYQIANILRRANLPEHSTEWLSGSELRELLFGHSAHGVTEPSNQEHTASFSPDGSVTMAGDWGAEPSGKARIMGRAFGQICIELPSKRERCAMVFRTYSGTRAKENEFTWVDTNGAFSFSQTN